MAKDLRVFFLVKSINNTSDTLYFVFRIMKIVWAKLYLETIWHVAAILIIVYNLHTKTKLRKFIDL